MKGAARACRQLPGIPITLLPDQNETAEQPEQERGPCYPNLRTPHVNMYCEAGKHFALTCKPCPGTAGASVLLPQAPATAQHRALHQRRAPQLPTEPGQLPAVLTAGEDAKKPLLRKQL